MKDVYSDNYKTLIKEIEDKQMERYNVLLDWKNIVKMTILPKAIRFNAIKIPMEFFTELAF